MRILVTGNMGYVGPVVVRHLRARCPEATLIGHDAGFFADCLTTQDGLPEAALDTQHFGDIRDLPPALLDGVDAVVHLAAISNDPMGSRWEAATAEINARASIRLAALAHQAGVRAFVFASSCSIYGFAEGGPRREGDALNPLTAYARSKVAVEDSLHALQPQAMTVTCLRFATACGMSPRLRLDLVLNDFVAGAVAGREITVLSDGSPWRPLIEVRDMARAVEWAIGRDPAQGGRVLSVNVGSDAWNLQVRDIATAVAQEVPGTQVSINRAAPPDRRSYRVDFGLFRALAPQHQPRIGLAEAVRGVRDGLGALGFADAGFREGRLMRLRMLDAVLRRGQLGEDLRRVPPAAGRVAA
ncbi:NAD-dependent epimerase/dehydratase family protein [Falsiroseomonas oryzae]|uniref:NAD-dependent epimerase/dehydratase family protein n=1 Tax=Falsiroseomonas oryzae TaxID=2766473 RepID=UPI0022EA9E7B|nr:SDR family oxidoreductase [Roseomonas sp. MO-31]